MKPTIDDIDIAIGGFPPIMSREDETILFALRFTKKIMGEPSDGMMKAFEKAYYNDDYHYIFKAMVNQAIKEVEDEN